LWLQRVAVSPISGRKVGGDDGWRWLVVLDWLVVRWAMSMHQANAHVLDYLSVHCSCSLLLTSLVAAVTRVGHFPPLPSLPTETHLIPRYMENKKRWFLRIIFLANFFFFLFMR
jgi:CHASE2 domain-containing sensor protein